MSEFIKIDEATFEIPKVGKMRVPGLVIATDDLMQDLEFDKPIEQVRNVATLPGIIGYSVAMPDIHWGYGFPIGGVAAMDRETGVISPGGVGYDINCGVRLALLPLAFSSLSERTKQEFLQALYDEIPSGVGRDKETDHALTDQEYRELIEKGARFSLERGAGYEEDLEHMESHGRIEGATLDAVSRTARDRGRKQLGSIGSGNHFVEIGAVEQIFLEETAKAWGVESGQGYVLIHSGSRGFGHQICQDTLDLFLKKGYAQDLVDPQLVFAPIQSPEGQTYFQAMAAAANFAFNNRQQILTTVRHAAQRILRIDPRQVKLLYDVCHNIAKFEEHTVNGKQTTLCVHRKGATRAYGKGAKELSPLFQSTGQPVLVPGDMGRSSFLLVGLGNNRTWCSCCHGAGRARSRVKSSDAWKGKDPISFMQNQGVLVKARSHKTIIEEMPDAYKDVERVVLACEEAKLANRVARLRPSLVIKG